MPMIKRSLFISVAAFFIIFGYFFFGYHYHPGLAVSFQGHIPKDVRGTLYWDYGAGFLEHNSIEVLLSSSGKNSGINLGKITVEPSGIKNTDSRGYLTWLVIPEKQYDNPDFVIDGRHHWGRWMMITKHKRGRQLALFPDSKISFSNKAAKYTFKFFQTPQSGIAKISSEHGEIQYYDSYGLNSRWDISLFRYYSSSPGVINYVKDPFRKRFRTTLPLPHQKMHGLKFKQFDEDLLSNIHPIQMLVVRPKGNDFPLILKTIQINGQTLKQTDNGVTFSGEWDESGLSFRSAEDFLEINGAIVSYEIVLPREQENKVSILVDTQESKEQSRQSRKGAMVNIYGQAPVDTFDFRLQSIAVMDVTEKVHPIHPIVLSRGESLFENIHKLKQSTFSQMLLATQLLTAGVLTLILSWFLSLPVFSETKKLKELPYALFIQKGRWLFWVVFISGLGWNMLWLLAEWPGCLTPDSVHVHGEAKRLLLTNHHPYIYTLFVLGLYNLYDSPLTVIIFQLFSFYAVVAWWLYFLFRNGVRWFLILPFYFLTFLSVPVNLFNITMWKDIPYNTLVLFWAFFLTACYFLKRKGKIVHLTITQLLLLSIAFLFLCTFRHNGLIYVPLVPFCLIFFAKIDRKRLAGFFVFSGLLLMLVYKILPGYLLYDSPKKNDFARVVVTRNLNKAATISNTEQKYYVEHYLSDRVRRFTATLGASPEATTWYNDMQNPPQRWFSVDELRAEWSVQAKIAFLVKYKNRALETRVFKGFHSGRFLHWNSAFGLLALIAVFMLYKCLPLSALYSSFFLVQAAGMFFVVWPRWRYLYFLYLGGMYLIFVLLLEFASRGKQIEIYDD